MWQTNRLEVKSQVNELYNQLINYIPKIKENRLKRQMCEKRQWYEEGENQGEDGDE